MNDKNNKLTSFQLIISVIGGLILIFTSILGIDSVLKYTRYNSPTVRFNNNYIYCQRYEPLSIGNGKSKYSHIDTITLNFVLTNNNPNKNFSIGDLHLFVTENTKAGKKEFERFIKDKKIIDSDIIYQAQYIFENFSWGDVVHYNNMGSFQFMGIPSNNVKVCNIEFYPINWWDTSKGNIHLNFKENTTYCIVLFEGYSNNYYEDSKWTDKGWKIENILNSDNVHKITIWEGTVSGNEILDSEKKVKDEKINYLNEIRDKLKSGAIKLEQLDDNTKTDLNAEPESIVKGNIY